MTFPSSTFLALNIRCIVLGSQAYSVPVVFSVSRFEYLFKLAVDLAAYFGGVLFRAVSKVNMYL
jgi:hypothetical protein